MTNNGSGNSSAEETGINDKILGFSLLGINILIVISNILAIMVIYRIRHKSAIDIFIMSLAVMDLLKGLIPVPITVSIYLTNWYLELGSVECQFFGWIAFTTNSGSMLLLALMSMERFWAVVKPFAYKAHVTPKRTFYVTCCAFIFSAIHSALPILGVGRMLPYYKGAYSHFDYSRHSKGTIAYSIFIIAYGFSMMFIVMIAYSFVFYKIRNLIHRHKRMSIHVSKRRSGEPKELNLKTEKMFSYLTVVLMLLFWFSWLPFLIVVLASQLGVEKPPEKLDMIAMRVAVLNSMMNPLACALMCKPYRRGIVYYFKKLFHFFGKTSPESDVFDPWHRNSFRSQNRKYRISSQGQDENTQRDYQGSSYDSGIATGEYSRTRIPSFLETYDSYRKRMNTTTSSLTDDNSPGSHRLGTVTETSSQRGSIDEHTEEHTLLSKHEQQLSTDIEKRFSQLSLESETESQPENEKKDNVIVDKKDDINQSLLLGTALSINRNNSPTTNRLLSKVHKYFSRNKENHAHRHKHSRKSRSSSANDALDDKFKYTSNELQQGSKSLLELEYESTLDSYENIDIEKIAKIQRKNENANNLEEIQQDLNNYKINEYKDRNGTFIEKDDEMLNDANCPSKEKCEVSSNTIPQIKNVNFTGETEKLSDHSGPITRERCASDTAMKKRPVKKNEPRMSTSGMDAPLELIDQLTKQLIDFSTSDINLDRNSIKVT